MDEPLNTQGTNPPVVPPVPETKPSFGFPPETPIAPGTVDHQIDPAPATPAPQTAPAPVVTPAAPKTTPIPNVILPQHAQAPATTPAPAPQIPPVLQPESAPVAPSTPPPSAPEEKLPVRTSMQDVPVRGISPETAGTLVPPTAATHTTPPLKPTGTPQAPARPSAKDALYQSALGAPLDGPVIPSTRPQPQMQPAPKTPGENSVSSAGPAATPAEAANELARRTAIRTLESDVATTIEQNRLSVSGIALAQQKKLAEEAVENIPEGKKFSWWALSGIVLALLGAGIITVAYLMQANAPEPTEEVVTTPDALIPSVPETTLDITLMSRANVVRALSELTGQYASRSGISLIRLISYSEETIEGEQVRVQKDVPAEQFFTQISAHAPSRLSRALGKQTYFGIVSSGGKPIPFLVFETSSYDSAFAAMLEWEQFILGDLPFLTHTPPAPTPAPQPAATTTPVATTTTPVATTTPTTSTATPPARPAVATVSAPVVVFSDVVVKNHDARLYKNPDGSTKLLYAFPTPVMLLIAQNEEALAAIIEHLNTARFSR